MKKLIIILLIPLSLNGILHEKEVLIIKKIVLSLLISSTLGGAILQPAAIVHANEKSSEIEMSQSESTETKVTNSEALAIYKDLINDQNESISKARVFSEKSEKTIGDLPEEFTDFTLLENTDQENMDTIYSEGDQEVHTTINYNNDSDTYSLFETNMDTGEVIIIINEKEFTVVADGENLNMISENGEVLPLLITEYEDTPEAIPHSIDLESDTIMSDTEIIVPQGEETMTLFAAAKFGKEYGPFKKTNKTLVEILGIISAGTAAAAFKVKHPALGIISGITGIAGTVGNYAYKTLYIKYWQSHSTTNYSYVKERGNYYNYNNYTGFVKSRTHHFYSSRP